MKSANPHQTAAVSAPATGASIVASADTLPARVNTLRAEALRQLLEGETLTGFDAVFDAGSTRLAAVMYDLKVEYGWTIERSDKVVGCNDGRVQTVTEYRLLPSIIYEAMRNGAGSWCKEVRAARALRRTEAAAARRRAALANVSRGKPRALASAAAQADLFQAFAGAAP